MTDDRIRHGAAHDSTPDDDGSDTDGFDADEFEFGDVEDRPEDQFWLDRRTETPDEPAPIAGRTLEGGPDALDVLLRIVGSERDGAPALWFLVLDACDRVLPLVLPIAELPTVSDKEVAANLIHVLASILEHDAPGGSVVVGYVRAGGGDRGVFEAGWSSALHASADREGVRIRAEVAIGRDRARVLPVQW